MMGIWFGATAVANYLAGTLENLLAGSQIPLYWFLVGSSMGAGLYSGYHAFTVAADARQRMTASTE